MSELRIPIAIDADDGRFVPAHLGAKGRSYLCPGCKSPVVWRLFVDGAKRNHFAHLGDESSCGESAVHAGAKGLVAQRINAWNTGEAPRPTISVVCPSCHDPWDRPVPFPIGPAFVEWTIGDYRADVFASGWAIEIVHAHAVDASKAAGLEALAVPWLEIEALGVLEDPAVWRVRAWSIAQVVDDCIDRRCPGCAEEDRDSAAFSAREMWQDFERARSQAGQMEARVATLKQEEQGFPLRIRSLALQQERLEAERIDLTARIKSLRAEVVTLEEERRRRMVALADVAFAAKARAAERSKIVQFLVSPCIPECDAARAAHSLIPKPTPVATATNYRSYQLGATKPDVEP